MLQKLLDFGDDKGYFEIRKIKDLYKSCCKNAETEVIDFDKTKEIISKEEEYPERPKSCDALKIIPEKNILDFIELKGWQEFKRHNEPISDENIEEQINKFNFKDKIKDSYSILKVILDNFHITENELEQFEEVKKNFYIVIDIEDIKTSWLDRIVLAMKMPKIDKKIIILMENEIKGLSAIHTNKPKLLSCKEIDEHYDEIIPRKSSSICVSPSLSLKGELKMAKSQVAVLKTTPKTVLDDYKRLLRSINYQEYLPKDKDTALKINISWGKFYPACSTTPWQLEGIIQTLLEDGYSKDLIHGCHNDTVVVNSREGERNNKHINVIEKYNLRNIHLYENEDWVKYEPKQPFLILDKVYPKGVYIPKRFIGENIIQLPTMKTHVFTTMTGAMKNAFGGLLHRNRHWTHSVIHETLVDLLMISQDIHSGLFAVMDGNVIGSGPGPRCMEILDGGYILASADQVAIDAVSAKMMGFEPMKLDFIRLADERGLGIGRIEDIEIVGDDISNVNINCKPATTFASRGQHTLYHGMFKPLERLLTHTPLVVLTYIASWAYHDWYWYPFIGSKRVKKYLESDWGKLFLSY